ncbi:hypothetical protein E4V01_20410 [Methylorubrum sp. Q1]|uniref:hypothetical protein n=1 Tax=Methylorubrum sp. Q1 TaxID=2562453 RepID=UPI0010764563|nr:hypothetical protein [Methylorubrum sp. Q1]TFZ56067.1 hypothetical protein E4V01_20410 [Methylorubrum sp. Q1]
MSDHRQEIEGLMQCPDDWDAIFPDITAVTDAWHKMDWYYCHQKFCFRGDEQAVIRAMAESDESVFDRSGIDWREVRDNIAFRRADALNEYCMRAHKIAKITYLSPSYNGKHYIGSDEKEIVRRSLKNRSVSLFLEDYEPDRLKNGFAQWMINYFNDSTFYDDPNSVNQFEDYISANDESGALYGHVRSKVWRSIFGQHNTRIAFEVAYPVGFKAGKELDHICFDIEMSSKTLHAYPISKQEAVSIMGGEDEVVMNKPIWW